VKFSCPQFVIYALIRGAGGGLESTEQPAQTLQNIGARPEYATTPVIFTMDSLDTVSDSPLRGAGSASIRVVHYDEASHRLEWDSFVQRSMNGTAFHLQQFLSYHAAGKFDFQHLLFYAGDRLTAVLPGGFRKGTRIYESPLGASYGSFVVEDITAEVALNIVKAFEQFVFENGIDEVFLTAVPVVYQPVLTQNLDFALLYLGYTYQRHYISHVAALRKEGVPEERFHAVARRYIRRALRNYPEIEIEEVRVDDFPARAAEFYPIMLSNKEKHNTTPTHSLEDLVKLHELMPNLMKLWLLRNNGELIAGFLIFLPNERVALSFYPMMRYEFSDLRPIYLLTDVVTRWAKEHGYKFFDFGVSQDTNDENPMTPAISLIQFKEKFDSRGVLRSTLWKKYFASQKAELH
jgi:hypothetical protein